MSIVETTLSDGGIDHESRRLGGGFVGVVNRIPAQDSLTISSQLYTETIGG